MDVLIKQEARRVVRDNLSALSQDDYMLSAVTVRRRIYTLLAKLHEDGALGTVLSYRSVPKWHEIDVSTLEAKFPDIRFDYAPVDAQAPFPAGPYDVVLVPLFGFNAEGYRLGQGGGWYDKFLATQPYAYKVGVGLGANRVEFAPELHDIPMDMIVTELE